MSSASAVAPSEVKREQDGDEVVVDPLLPHRNNGNNHPMTPPDHQNDVIMKVQYRQSNLTGRRAGNGGKLSNS